MIVWLIAGVLLGLVLGKLARLVPRSELADLGYITLLAAFTRKHRHPGTDSLPEPKEHQEKTWRAAAGRMTLL